MGWFSKSASPAERRLEPSVEDEREGACPAEGRSEHEDREAQFDAECTAAEAAFNSAFAAETAYSVAHPARPFLFKTGNTLRIQTRVDDSARAALEKQSRLAYERRNKALRERALFRNPGLNL